VPLPAEPVLRAAVRWLEELPSSGIARCRALFTTHAEFSDITPTQYDAALAWLSETGLLDDLHSRRQVQNRVFSSALLSSGAPWLADADLLIRSPSELPEDVVRAAEALGINGMQAYQELQAVWGKVDTEERSRIGVAGELALVNLLVSSTNAEVEHVAAHSDGYGYDIAVHAGRHSLHIEVKSTVRRNRLTVFLSRHELETMRQDPYWQLVIVRLTNELTMAAVSEVPSSWIATHVPCDRNPCGRWESCRLDIPPEETTAGIPRLAPILGAKPSSLLDGTAG
jgi:hypothetical protein